MEKEKVFRGWELRVMERRDWRVFFIEYNWRYLRSIFYIRVGDFCYVCVEGF